MTLFFSLKHYAPFDFFFNRIHVPWNSFHLTEIGQLFWNWFNPFTRINEVLVVIGKGSGIMSLPGDARANLTVSPQSCMI